MERKTNSILKLAKKLAKKNIDTSIEFESIYNKGLGYAENFLGQEYAKACAENAFKLFEEKSLDSIGRSYSVLITSLLKLKDEHIILGIEEYKNKFKEIHPEYMDNETNDFNNEILKKMSVENRHDLYSDIKAGKIYKIKN